LLEAQVALLTVGASKAGVALALGLGGALAVSGAALRGAGRAARALLAKLARRLRLLLAITCGRGRRCNLLLLGQPKLALGPVEAGETETLALGIALAVSVTVGKQAPGQQLV